MPTATICHHARPRFAARIFAWPLMRQPAPSPDARVYEQVTRVIDALRACNASPRRTPARRA